MSCSRTQHDDACVDRTQYLSSPTLHHYATALPQIFANKGHFGSVLRKLNRVLSILRIYKHDSSVACPIHILECLESDPHDRYDFHFFGSEMVLNTANPVYISPYRFTVRQKSSEVAVTSG